MPAQAGDEKRGGEGWDGEDDGVNAAPAEDAAGGGKGEGEPADLGIGEQEIGDEGAEALLEGAAGRGACGGCGGPSAAAADQVF